MSNLQPLKWVGNKSLSAIHSYEIKTNPSKDTLDLAIGGKYFVEKIRLATQKKEKVTGFRDVSQAEEWVNAHYRAKMRPYVKPSPTWIDASKQLPQVEKDTQFICSYGSALEPFSKAAWFNADIGEFNYEHDSVIAWMPIPEFSEVPSGQ